GASVGKIQLLGHHRAPAIEEIRADRDDEARGLEIKTRPGHSVALPVGGNDSVLGAGIVAQMRRHSETGEPRIQKSREAAALVLIDEHGIARTAFAARLTQLLRKDL